MAPMQYRRHYHAHETTDAFAEGWDAHEQTASAQNPYRILLTRIELAGPKRPPIQVENLRRNAELWDRGWAEQAEVAAEERAGGL
jgi:hypothetical protein